jgi:RND family efflux transporter MFP subunit
VVHQAATVVPFDRCVIGLYDRNKFILGAVSGEAEVPKTAEMEQLRGMLEWVATQAEPVRADNYEEGWEINVEEGRGLVTGFLDKYERNGFYAVPLKDEQGTVGVMALLSGDAEFLTESHLEILSILASQVTVAIRNARLYQEVPLMSVWQPLVERKQKLLSVSATRWLQVGAVALLLIVIPWKMRVTVNATVVPAERREVTSEVERVIRAVPVREGQVVEADAVLAELDDTDDRIRLARAEADLGMARRDLAEAEARRDLALATQARLRMEKHQAEAVLYRERVERARLRAPIAGVVVTPKVEEKVGKLLAAGETFCELVALDRMAVDMNVPETEVALVREQNAVTIKLNTYPADVFRGQVERVSAQTVSAEGEQFFVVRGVFDNPNGQAHPGMAGRAKISAHGGWFDSGWYPVGYVLLRAPASWVWRKLWTWLP